MTVTRCDECGFTYEDVPVGEIGTRIDALPERFRAALDGIDEPAARRRPAADVWSPLEYLCHVRDVLLVQRDRAVVALVEDRPGFARMHRDERVELCRYDAQSTGAVLDQLAMAARLASLVFDGIQTGTRARQAWARPLIYNFPEPTEQDLAWLGRHTLHEAEHHLYDVTRLLTLP